MGVVGLEVACMAERAWAFAGMAYLFLPFYAVRRQLSGYARDHADHGLRVLCSYATKGIKRGSASLLVPREASSGLADSPVSVYRGPPPCLKAVDGGRCALCRTFFRAPR